MIQKRNYSETNFKYAPECVPILKLQKRQGLT